MEEELELEKIRIKTEIEEEKKLKFMKSQSLKLSLLAEKTDITRKVNKSGTLILRANPLRQHIDLKEKHISSKNTIIVDPKKIICHHKYESGKTLPSITLRTFDDYK